MVGKLVRGRTVVTVIEIKYWGRKVSPEEREPPGKIRYYPKSPQRHPGLPPTFSQIQSQVSAVGLKSPQWELHSGKCSKTKPLDKNGEWSTPLAPSSKSGQEL